MERRESRSERGFTLVEILITIAIIGILLAIAVPRFVRARDGTNARSCQHNLKQILGAKERWAMDNNMGATSTPNMSDLVPDYMRSPVPRCPGGGTYTIGDLGTNPACSLGGTPGAFDAHVLP